ncbi:hypothetical protein GQ55_4G348400 [Panicum hallii var. hallii]|uniref:Uncharacterized protein n=1 Tax=Panicum hallii var. hallii TaxID=1504633 RepID=A0A2T7E3A9_9POAL|nr:hypothetical protein GQ55_4G348400 [Panicum hallii var. hallii]
MFNWSILIWPPHWKSSLVPERTKIADVAACRRRPARGGGFSGFGWTGASPDRSSANCGRAEGWKMYSHVFLSVPVIAPARRHSATTGSAFTTRTKLYSRHIEYLDTN